MQTNIKSFTISAPGKLHLLGEHAVVYGKPAIIAAIDKRCYVTITKRKDRIIEIIADNIGESKKLALQQVFRKTLAAQRAWEKFMKTNDTSILKAIALSPFDFVTICIGEALQYLKVKPTYGFTIKITLDIPIGKGMGSSGALAVAISGAVTKLFTNTFDKSVINDIAFICEQKQHGTPSGGDNSTSCYGGFIWFRRESPQLKIIQPLPFSMKKEISKNFLAVDTGKPAETTGEMVSMVRKLYEKRTKYVDNILNSQEQLTKKMLSVLSTGDEKELVQIIKEGEENLEKIGVVSPSSKKLIKDIEKIGGAAKICGGGGRTKTTGIVLSYLQQRKLLPDMLKSYGFTSFPITLGAEGVREEK